MTSEQKAEINKQNAQHSTGPKTEEGKAKSAQNALSHGLTSQIQPQNNPSFLAKLKAFQKEYPAFTPIHQTLVQELALLAWKLEQIPSMEYEIELNSGLTLAEHFMQDKPTPLVRLWNLQLRLLGRFNSLAKKLEALKMEMQNKPTQTPLPTPPSDPKNPSLEIKSPFSQNEPGKTIPQPHSALLKAIKSIPLPFPI